MFYNHKLLRFFTNGFRNKKRYLASFSNIYVFYTCFLRTYSFWTIFLIYSVIAAADIFILLTYTWYHYIFIIAIETLVFIVIMSIMLYCDYFFVKS